MKKETIKIIIINIILSFINFYVMAAFTLAAFINDYVEPITKTEQYLMFYSGVAIAILLDLLVNYISSKKIYKNGDKPKYLKIVVIPLIITILEAIYLLNG